MKIELQVFLIETVLTSFICVTMSLQWLVMSNLRHLDIVSAKIWLTPILFWCQNQSHFVFGDTYDWFCSDGSHLSKLLCSFFWNC